MLEFDEPTHTYRFDGKPVANVTRILASESPYGSLDPAMLEIARQKGKHVHKMIELDVAGTLDEGTLPDWMIPALVEWRRFRADTHFEVMFSEKKLFHPVFRYAGTLDLFGHLYPGTHVATPALIDLKRSFLAGHVTGLQTVAYLDALAYDADFEQLSPAEQKRISTKTQRFAMRLREDGRYKLERFADPKDRTDFLAALALYNRRVRYATTKDEPCLTT